MKNFKILKNPFIIILSIIVGIIVGIYFKEFALKIKIFGKIYLSLIKMCVIPILITAIISSVAQLFRSEDAKKYIKKILIVFLSLLFFTGILCVTIETFGKPGKNLGKQAEITLGKLLNKADKELQKGIIVNKEQGVIEFIKNMIPENIFSALNHGYSLQILFFAIIFGIATGFLSKANGEIIISFTEAFFKGFFKIIDWIMYLLPFGLFCLISSQIAGTGIEILLAMLKFVISIYIISFILIAINGILLSIYSKNSFVDCFLKLKECLLIGFGTQSTFASIPSAIDGLTEGLKLNRELINLIIPIGAVICRFSMVILYSAATIFTAQLYNVDLGIQGYITCLILSVIAAIAGAGTPGIVSITMISIVLLPLKLPAEAIIVMLLAVNPLIDPITTMTNIHSNCAAAAIIEGRR